jgi:hypothetical protein
MGEIISGRAQDLVMYLMGDDIDRAKVWDLSEHKDKRNRSIDSNRYFHLLCDKLRQKLGISMASCKNHLIADYGQVMYLEEGVPLIYKTNADEAYMLELETIHTKCVKVTEENGKPVFFYRVYRGSHDYNTSEMAQLIKGTVEECEAQGIQTATPDEIAHMQALWEAKYAKHHAG